MLRLDKKKRRGDVDKQRTNEASSFEAAGSGKTFVRSSDAGEAGGSIYELRGTPADVPSATSRTRHRASGRRAIDEFLDEIKSRETLRCLGAQVEGDPSPADQIAYPTAVDDAQNYESTNLFIGNLASTVTEEKLRQVFGVYGEIYSIKIMWPRSEEERRRSRNKGFVSFVRRDDAEDARNATDDKPIDGIRVTAIN